MKERDQKYSLVDAIFSVTDEGVVALAIICDELRVACDFEIIALNDGAARLLRSRAGDLRGRRFSEAFGDMGVEAMLANLLQVAVNGGSSRFEIDHASGPGENVQLTVNATAIGDLIGMTLTDISDIKAREASFRLLFDGSPMPTALCDPESFGFLAVNQAAAALWGFPQEALLAMNLYDVAVPEDRDLMRRCSKQPPVSPVTERLGRQLRSDGSVIDVVFYWRPLTFRDRPAQLVTFVDVTEKKQAERRLAHMAHHDALTDLPNRAMFRERLDEALSRLHPDQGELAVLYLDLDQFKAINDTLAIRLAMRCCARSPIGCAGACARATSWRDSAATNSPCSVRA